MSLTKSNIRQTLNLAVFTRNHGFHLESAAKNPKTLNTFRSSLRWVSAYKAVDCHGSIKLYSAVIDKDNLIEYEANLVKVKLDPKEDEAETQELLVHSVEGTAQESLWDGEVKTLYLIKDCKKLLNPFPVTELIKVKDNKAITPNYSYGYSIVFKHG